jgi:hypothetical protein
MSFWVACMSWPDWLSPDWSACCVRLGSFCAMFSASLSALSKMPMILPDAFPNVGDLRTFVLSRLTIDA